MGGSIQPQVPPVLVRLGLMLRAVRAPLTQEAFARKIGCSSRTVMRAERGDRLPTATLVNLWLAVQTFDRHLLAAFLGRPSTSSRPR